MEEILIHLLESRIELARTMASERFPYEKKFIGKRNYSKSTMLEVFFRDGFIDRYSGEQLYHPGFLRALSSILPEQFPFHPHGKANECHDIFWDKIPSLDHLNPIYRGGKDELTNYVTTSMKRNRAKNNWFIEELGWELHPPGDIHDWDGMSRGFIQLVDQYKLNSGYIKSWYGITKKKLNNLV